MNHIIRTHGKLDSRQKVFQQSRFFKSTLVVYANGRYSLGGSTAIPAVPKTFKLVGWVVRSLYSQSCHYCHYLKRGGQTINKFPWSTWQSFIAHSWHRLGVCSWHLPCRKEVFLPHVLTPIHIYHRRIDLIQWEKRSLACSLYGFTPSSHT